MGDAIRKKMQSLKGETDGLYATIRGFEEATKEATGRADQADCDIRDYGKKVQSLEIAYDETNDKLTKATESLEEADKQFKEVEGDVAALTRRIMLMEEEDKKSAEKALEREDKLVEKILGLQNKFKQTEAKFEYGEMNITKLNQKIDNIEDEIYREKLKIKKCSDELDETFEDMIAHY